MITKRVEVQPDVYDYHGYADTMQSVVVVAAHSDPTVVLAIGQYVSVQIIDCKAFTLFGKVSALV